MSNRLDPGQARHFVGPDLGPNCLLMLSADDTRRKRVKDMMMCAAALDVLEWNNVVVPGHYSRG